MNPIKVVITGGPSTGKTSVIKRIEERGFLCLHEISRSITLEARAEGIPQLFLTDPLRFSKRILEGRLAQFYEAENALTDIVFLDRGLPDVLAYMDGVHQKYTRDFVDACKNNRYDNVFLLPPWKDIYTADNERHENFDEAIRIHDFLERTYTNYGYRVQEVPISSVDERVNFILSALNK
ncbi:ATP-binding protein [Arenibacter sp. GZD96]|uniref:ATP-binding protein n=1 Tax=Aurantibrevibacter litoralis TaxID=3106030 RepID=UPI002AFEECBF|nr:ATP-binding protein [Arenibacter sp. GZD-96]MEA1787134.1 ATP-binding protein [Arenibacter sp. GZD-96]